MGPAPWVYSAFWDWAVTKPPGFQNLVASFVAHLILAPFPGITTRFRRRQTPLELDLIILGNLFPDEPLQVLVTNLIQGFAKKIHSQAVSSEVAILCGTLSGFRSTRDSLQPRQLLGRALSRQIIV